MVKWWKKKYRQPLSGKEQSIRSVIGDAYKSPQAYAHHLKSVPELLRKKSAWPGIVKSWKNARLRAAVAKNTERLEKIKSINYFVKTSLWEAPDATDAVGRLRQHRWRTRNLQFAKKVGRTLLRTAKPVLVKRDYNPDFMYHL